MRTSKIALFIGLLFPLPGLFGQSFRLEEIMKGYDFIGHSPENIRWSFDGQRILFDWNPNDTFGTTPYSYSLKEKGYQVVSPNTLLAEMPENGRIATGNFYFTQWGNLYRYKREAKLNEKVLSFKQGIYRVQTVNDPASVFFEMDDNLFSYNEKDGSILQITDFVKGTKPKDEDSTSLMRQQSRLFDYVRMERDKEKWYEENSRKRAFPKTIYYDKQQQLENLIISPNERFVAFRLSTYPQETDTYFEEFITSSGYTQRKSARAKVGDVDPQHTFAIYDRERDSSYVVSFASLTGIRKKPAYLKEYGDKEAIYEKDRSVIMHEPVMHPSGKSALCDIRSYDNKDRWIVLVDLEKGTIRELDHQHDEAWIGGPGISGWNAERGTLGWLDNDRCYFQSEATGYSHLYIVDLRTGEHKQLTSGKWEVHEVLLSKNKETFYLLTNKLNPGVRNGYSLSVKTGTLTPLFEGYFAIEWKLSPDEKKWAIRYSTSTQPWDLYLAENSPGAEMKQLTHSTHKSFEELPLKKPELINIPTSDNQNVAARLYRPEKPNGAAVLFVHGAGYLQNAHHYWSYYCREFLFHQLLREKGYTVLDVDYRASEGYGRDVRTAIYRHMGERDLLDFVDAKKYLTDSLKIDGKRVGIYGGSYGGFITLMGMLKTPGTFACGAALRSVTDWEHYNHEYTSNILNYPGTDPKAYEQSSPIYYAEGLQGPLLMLHGMEDDNVQFQDIIRLNQRFIELGKTNYQLAVFPTEAHGFTYTPAWIDEYRRILELFETHLK